MKKLILTILASSILVSVTYSKPKKTKPKCGATGFGDCSAKRCGGDGELNKKKNKTTKPAAADVEVYKRADFVKLKIPRESSTKKDICVAL